MTVSASRLRFRRDVRFLKSRVEADNFGLRLARICGVSSTYFARSQDVQPNWYVLDAKDHIVGRLASQIATVLMGKHKPMYTPHVDCGDYVIVLNAGSIRFSGAKLAHPRNPNHTTKMERKTYERYSGYPGGRTVTKAIDVWESKPEKILYEAVRRMMPKNKLSRQMLKKLKLCVGTEHSHQAQQPQDFPSHLLPR